MTDTPERFGFETQWEATPVDKLRDAHALARMNAARIGPGVTCPVSRHAAIIATALIEGDGYPMLSEDPAYCGETIASVVASLWEARAPTLADALAVPTTAAERDVLLERSRQVVEEEWDAEHDDCHTQGELAAAAGCYAWIAAKSDALRAVFDRPPPTWPVEWDEDWWKPTDRRRDLVKAGALILAEIERLDRAALAVMEGRE